jgi:hypothetical protein
MFSFPSLFWSRQANKSIVIFDLSRYVRKVTPVQVLMPGGMLGGGF